MRYILLMLIIILITGCSIDSCEDFCKSKGYKTGQCQQCGMQYYENSLCDTEHFFGGRELNDLCTPGDGIKIDSTAKGCLCGKNSPETKWDLVPTEFHMVKISEDEYEFSYKENDNKYILDDTWGDGIPIRSHEKPLCVRGSTFSPEIRKNYGITANSMDFFYCSPILYYKIESTIAGRFQIWKVVLRETDIPDVLEVVTYKFLEEDY